MKNLDKLLDITKQNILLGLITAVAFSTIFVVVTDNINPVAFAFCLALASPYSRLFFSRRNKQVFDTNAEQNKDFVTFEKSGSINIMEYRKYWLFAVAVYGSIFILYKVFLNDSWVRASAILFGVILTTSYLFIKKIPTRKSDFKGCSRTWLNSTETPIYKSPDLLQNNTYKSPLADHKPMEHPTPFDPASYGSTASNFLNPYRDR